LRLSRSSRLLYNIYVIVSFVAGWRVEEHGTRVRDFVSALADDRAFDEAVALIKLVRERGNTLREPRSKPLGDGLFELRGKSVRIFYIFRPDRRVVLLDGIVKKRTDIPGDVIERLRRLQREVK
jgi:hypothetical protein